MEEVLSKNVRGCQHNHERRARQCICLRRVLTRERRHRSHDNGRRYRPEEGECASERPSEEARQHYKIEHISAVAV